MIIIHIQVHSAGLHNKLLKPLAQGASRFEKLLARKKSYWPEKITGLNFRNQRRDYIQNMIRKKKKQEKKLCGPSGQ